ncbi:MAG: magnesium transporter [Planctomycetota bacterium]
MVNPLYLPELREYLAEHNTAELKEFCEALHPARTADFMEGLEPAEAWEVLKHTDLARRVEIFEFFQEELQVAMMEAVSRAEMAELVAALAPDDRVDLLKQVDPAIVDELLPLVPSDDRRDILHLKSYPEGTAGAVMTTEVAKLDESLTVKEALDKLQAVAAELETIYYLYVVDAHDHLRGLVSARQLLSAMRTPDVRLGDLMETGLVTVEVDDDQEEVAQKVAKYDLVAIPVVDAERKMLGIITYDDVIDVVMEEATEDAHRSAAVAPLENRYLQTSLVTLAWKRGVWLIILFAAALLTAFALRHYETDLERWQWLVFFVPLVISSGGNSGNQSATLVITGLTAGDIELSDWFKLTRREILQGLMLGTFLALCALVTAPLISKHPWNTAGAWVVPITILSVVLCGTLVGALLPLIFKRMGLDPALMSNPFVAGIIDIVGIVVYMNVAWLLMM